MDDNAVAELERREREIAEEDAELQALFAAQAAKRTRLAAEKARLLQATTARLTTPTQALEDDRFSTHKNKSRSSSVSFSSGYGLRGPNLHRADEPLPPEEERIGPEGSRHRIYPAKSPIEAPVNIDEGWDTTTPDLMSDSHYTVEASPSLESPRRPELEIEIEPAHAKPSVPQNDEPNLPMTTPARSASTYSNGGALGGWEPVVSFDKTAAGLEEYEALLVQHRGVPIEMLGRPVPRGQDSGVSGRSGGFGGGGGGGGCGGGGGGGGGGGFGSGAQDSGWGARGGGPPRQQDSGWGNNNGDGDDGDAWGQSARDPPPHRSGGDFGGGGYGSGGGDTCYGCGNPGHIRANCPDGGGPGACYGCGESGHIRAECPQGGGGGPGACYGCGETGHIRAECPQGGGGGPGACYGCGETGHIRAECPQGGGGGPGACYGCGEHGHLRAECPQGGGGGGGGACYGCGQPGHIRADCPDPSSSVFRGTCHECGETGHMRSQCPGGGGGGGSGRNGGSGGGYDRGYGGGGNNWGGGNTSNGNATWGGGNNSGSPNDQQHNTSGGNDGWGGGHQSSADNGDDSWGNTQKNQSYHDAAPISNSAAADDDGWNTPAPASAPAPAETPSQRPSRGSFVHPDRLKNVPDENRLAAPIRQPGGPRDDNNFGSRQSGPGMSVRPPQGERREGWENRHTPPAPRPREEHAPAPAPAANDEYDGW